MEVVIPPRDHGGQTYKYEWDEQGEVTNIQSPEDAHLPYRPATWQPRRGALRGYGGMYGDNDDTDDEEGTERATLRRSLIPDYVINYLRGETPETVAQRKIERQNQQQQQGLDEETASAQQGEIEARLRGGGSRNSQVDGQPMPSPGYRRSDEPILRNNYSEKRRSYGTNGARRRQTRRGIVAHGWRAGVALHGFLAVIVFVVGLVSLIVALVVQKRDSTGNKSMQMVTIFSAGSNTGNAVCSAAYPVAWILRAVLSLFTVALLAGAQYVFQVLSSPTRAELDAAHASRKWLDIGVPSMRNLMFLLRYRKSAADGGGGGARFRSVLALVVIAVAITSAVLYGSLVNVALITPLATASSATPAYNVLLVTPAFLQGAPFSNSSSNNAGGLDRVTILQLQQLAANSKQQTLTNLTAAECLQAQSSASTSSELQGELELFQTNEESSNSNGISSSSFSAVLIVLTDAAVTTLQATNSSVVQTAPAGSELLAAASQNIDSDSTGSINSVFEITTDDSDNGRSTFVINESDVAFCYVQETANATTTDDADGVAASTCNVTVNTMLLSTIVGLNVVTILCFGFVLLPSKAHRHFRHAPLITLGDAVASFLRDPDPTTRGACLLSKTDVVQHGVWKSMVGMPRLPAFGTGDARQSTQSDRSGQSAQRPENIIQPMFLQAAPDDEVQVAGRSSVDGSSNYYWSHSVSLSRWFAGALVWWLLVGLALAALVVIVTSSSGLGTFGQIAPLKDVVYGSFSSSSTSPTPWISTAILASLPQIGVALLYLLSDAHLSAYFLSHESSLFVATHQHHRNEQLQQHCRRPLRVSYRPRGHQTTSLYLSLPQLWNWTLLVLFSGIVFSLGQSVVVEGVQATKGSATQPQLVLLGFSGVGLVVFLVLLLAMALLVLVLSVRRTPPPNASLGRNPLTLPGGSCSAVISARCHPMPEEMAAEMTGANLNGSNGGPLPLWLRPLAWGPVPSYRHPYQGYNRRRGLTRDGTLAGEMNGDGDCEEDNIDSIVGHCTYSSGPLVPLDVARSYA
ncbi:hypothetical protein SEUCBS139899_000264 [Sporothrix eucalyptigena]